MFYERRIEKRIRKVLERDKSVLLLGPRQTGKTTMIMNKIEPDIVYSFAKLSTKQRYERQPELLEKELSTVLTDYTYKPVILIDEVQKIPQIMDAVQYLIDNQQALFILTGSSARKLKHGKQLNLLPGRVVTLFMNPLLACELPEQVGLTQLLLYGCLPGIYALEDDEQRAEDLQSYTTAYLEEEVRSEALVRNVGMFARFLQLAAGESGKQANLTQMSQDVGVTDTTIANYYQILEDCLIVNRLDPIIHSQSKRRLIKSPRYLFFDLGVRRFCANEGTQLPQRMMAELFEQLVGNELIYHSELVRSQVKVRYWRDASTGAEIDYVLDMAQQYVPIEVKMTDKPSSKDARHLKKFIQEYQCERGYIICRTPVPYKITDNVHAINWDAVEDLFI